MTSDVVDKIVSGIKKVESAFKEIRPSLETKILNTTAVIAYHKIPIVYTPEELMDIKKLKGLIFPPQDIAKRHGLWDKIVRANIYVPKVKKDIDVYLGVDVTVKNPKEVLLYGFQHLDKSPQKIMQNPDGSYYLTQKPLLVGGNIFHPEPIPYILTMQTAIASHYVRDTTSEIAKLTKKLTPKNLKSL